MHIDFQMTDEILIATLTGELDHHSATVIREEIDKTIEAFLSKHLIFDFGKVGFMDSSGIGVIMGRYKKISQLGGQVIIVGCSDYVHRILEMAGIFTIADKQNSLEDAIQKIKSELSKEEVDGSEG